MTAPPRFDRPSLRLHACAVPGCGRQVPVHLLMCMEHWRMVPAKLARSVSRTWHGRDRGAQDRADYEAECAAAVLAVQGKVFTKLVKKSPEGAQAETMGDLFA